MDIQSVSKKIGLFYGSSTCYTEIAAEKITAKLLEIIHKNKLDHIVSIELFNTKETSLKLCEDFDILIFGISTWDFGEIQEDWLKQWHNISTLKLDNKIVALFGLGDQEGYSDWFLDAMGLLYKELSIQSIHWTGFWPTEGYTFNSVLPVIAEGEFFVGLALDEDSQYELSEARVDMWCHQLVEEWMSILINT